MNKINRVKKGASIEIVHFFSYINKYKLATFSLHILEIIHVKANGDPLKRLTPCIIYLFSFQYLYTKQSLTRGRCVLHPNTKLQESCKTYILHIS